MSQTNWEAAKMLDVYIYDYLIKRDLKATAQAFQPEEKESSDPVAIDAPAGFLFEWWSVFWDIFIARTNKKHSEVAASYIESLNGHSSPIESVAFDSAEVLAAAGASSGVIKLWDLEETKGQHIKAIITADEFLLRDPLEDNVAPVVEELRRRIKSIHNAHSEDHGDSKEVTTQHDIETGEEDDTACPFRKWWVEAFLRKPFLLNLNYLFFRHHYTKEAFEKTFKIADINPRKTVVSSMKRQSAPNLLRLR